MAGRFHSVIVVLEDFLAAATPTGTLSGATPIPESVAMVQGWRRDASVVVWTSNPEDVAVAWLVANLGDIEGVRVIPSSRWPKDRIVSSCRTLGYEVSLYVDASPAGCAQALSQGVNTMCFSSPAYVRPQFRPDAPAGAIEWTQLIGEIEHQQEMHATDGRRDPDAASSRFESH